jgi:endoglucanase
MSGQSSNIGKNMQRRHLLTMLPAASILGTPALAQDASGHSAWEAWKTTFLEPDGRVVDSLQDGVSHSEGQGWALLLAAHAEDDASFKQIFDWTERHLAVRHDPLLAWRWRPVDGVTDYNNATDGDIFYAWALLVASRRFGVRAYAERAGEVARAIDDIVVRDAPDGGLLLRPGAEQFTKNGSEIVNPSYIMPLALHSLGGAFGLPRLGQVASDGEALIARIADTGLVPDWVALHADGWRPAETGPYHSYDAMRVALYLVWSGRHAHPAVKQVRALFADRSLAPAVRAHPETLEVLERSSEPGYAALSDLILKTAEAASQTPVRAFTADQPYYPATLHLLTLLAEQTIRATT